MDWFDKLHYFDQAVLTAILITFLIFVFSVLTIGLGKLFFGAMEMMRKRIKVSKEGYK